MTKTIKRKALSKEEFFILKGAAFSQGELTKEQIYSLFSHIVALEDLLKEADSEDFYGTEGWRHYLGVD
jgi:hypothetical protein